MFRHLKPPCGMTTVTSEPTAAQWDDFLYLKFSLANWHFPIPFSDVLWIGQIALLKQNTNHAFIRLLGRTKPRRGDGGRGGLPLFIKNQLLWFWNANQIKISTRPGGLIYILNEPACCERALLLPPLSLFLSFLKKTFEETFVYLTWCLQQPHELGKEDCPLFMTGLIDLPLAGATQWEVLCG